MLAAARLGGVRADGLRAPVGHRPEGAHARGHRGGDLAEPRAVPPHRAEDEPFGAQLAGPVAVDRRAGDQCWAGAAESLDCHVGVAQQQQPGAVIGQHPQQPGRRRGALLVVVHHDQPPAWPRGRGDLVVPGEERLGRLVDHHGGVVPGAHVGRSRAQQRDVEVLLVEPRGGHPGRPVVARAQLGEVDRHEAAFGRAHQQVAQLVAEGAQAQGLGGDGGRPLERGALPLGMAGEQLREQQVLLGAGDQRGRRVAQQRGLGAQHGERRGGSGAHHGLA